MSTKIGQPENRKRLKGLGVEKAISKAVDEAWNAGFEAGFKAGVLSFMEDEDNADI